MDLGKSCVFQTGNMIPAGRWTLARTAEDQAHQRDQERCQQAKPPEHHLLQVIDAAVELIPNQLQFQ